MNAKNIVILLIFLIVICTLTFSIIYFIDENSDESYEDAIYTSIQVQTSIGMSNASDRLSLRNWITAQSIIAYTLNILLVLYLSAMVGSVVVEAKI